MKDKDLLDILLDKDNTDPLTLKDDKGKEIVFEQIAIIPYNQKIYCILRPLDGLNVEEDEAIVFYVEDEEDDPVLMVETDKEISTAVFDAYYDMLKDDILGGKKDD